MTAPRVIETDRLSLRPPEASDAEAIFERYAGDPEVTHYLSWPLHRSLSDTQVFVEFSQAEWKSWPAGPYLVFSREDDRLLGGTGLKFETPHLAETGYVFAKDAWGRGYATETLQAMVALARSLDVRRLVAICHPDHRRSQRVLEKCGFRCLKTERRWAEFPNIDPGERVEVLFYASSFER